jgi:antitoxin (DNA-binding transcriptional repressor) of toxin-antitoxin stability system
MIDLVEQGETVRILRHGKAVAEIVPPKPDAAAKVPHWKRPIVPVEYQRADGKTLAQIVIEERENARY